LIKSRLYGGASLVMVVDGAGSQDQELDLERVTRDSLKAVQVVARHDLGSGPLEPDIMSPNYGMPQYYERSNPSLVRLHPSRVVRLQGSELPDMTLSNDGWSDSVLQVVDDAMRACGLVMGSVSTMVQEANFDIVRIPGLTANVTTDEYEKNLTRRFTYSNNAKSVINSILLDKEEEWDRITTSFAGLPDIIKLYLLVVSSAAHIPATVMLGQSAVGLNATGEGDTRNHYDRISSEQNTVMTPAMYTLDEVLIRSAIGSRPEDIYYEWNPLWQLSDVETATRDKALADTFKIDVDTALINPDVLRTVRINQLVENATYPGLEDAVDEFGDEPTEPEGQFDPITGLPTDPVLQAAQKVAASAANQNQPPDPKAAAAANEGKLFGRTKAAADAVLLADARSRFGDAEPRTVYLRRPVINAAAIVRHFAQQGVEDLYDPVQLHVTIMYSKTPIDWMKLGSSWSGSDDGRLHIPPGGIRLMDPLGDPGEQVLALLFVNNDLAWRFRCCIDAGCENKWGDQYQPHITIGKSVPENYRTLDPWQGAIELGPEIIEEADPNWRENM
jgi:phage-related protein (TIGR01555 family)